MSKNQKIGLRVDDKIRGLLHKIANKEGTDASKFLTNKILNHEADQAIIVKSKFQEKELEDAKSTISTLKSKLLGYDNKQLDLLYKNLEGKEVYGKKISSKLDLQRLIVANFKYEVQEDKTIVMHEAAIVTIPEEEPIKPFLINWKKIGILTGITFLIGGLIWFFSKKSTSESY